MVVGQCNQTIIFLFLNHNISYVVSTVQSHLDGSFEHQKQVLKLKDDKMSTIVC